MVQRRHPGIARGNRPDGPLLRTPPRHRPSVSKAPVKRRTTQKASTVAGTAPAPAPAGPDPTDLAIIETLRANGRANNQQVADMLGLTATTVSTRIRRMEDANQLRVVAVSDFSAHGFNVLLRISVSVDGRPASDVAHELAALPEVVAAHLVTGGYDIDMLVALHDFDDLSEFLLDKLSGVHGIRTLTPAIVVDIIKYQFDVAPIEGKA
nr:Lrp/AsnC family transcriptional regulator [Novosphingobium jiangmenense]